MKSTRRLLAYITSALMLLNPAVVQAASRTSAFTKANPQGTFQNPATTNHFSRLVGQGGRGGGHGSGCPTCPEAGAHAGGCAGCGGSAGAPSVPCPTCPGGSRAAGCPSCPNGGGLAAGDCPTCGRGPNLKVAGCTKCGEPEGLLAPGGEFYYAKTDLVVPGVGLDFRMCRIYRSGITYDGPLGKKWEFCHNVRIKETQYSIGEAIDVTDAAWTGMGREDTFTSTDGGPYSKPAGWFGTMTKPSASEYKFVEPEGLTWRFESDPGAANWFRLLEKKDRNGNRLAYYYDNGSKLTKVRDTLDRDYLLDYDSNGRITKASDFGNPSAREVVYGYNTSGLLTSVRTPTVNAEEDQDDFTSGKTTTYSYDANDRLTEVKNPRDSSAYLVNSYDSGGKLTQQQAGPSGSNYSMTYDGTNRKVTVTDREGNKTVHWYDTSNRITKVDLHGTTIGTGKTYQFAYASNDLITKVTYPRGNLVEFVFNSNGSVVTQKRKTDASDTGLVTLFTHTTDFNQVSTITDPEGRVTDNDFDSSGNLTKVTMPTVTSPSGISTTDKNGNSINDGVIVRTYSYTSNGQVATAVDPRGTTTTYTYSAIGVLSAYRTKETIDSAGLNLTRQWAYDQFGNVTSTTDGENKTTTYVVNELNQVLKVTNPLGFVTKFHYDANDNLIKTEVENDNEVGTAWFVTDYQYDLLNDLTKAIQDVDDTSNRITTTYAYDKSERLTKVTKPAGNEVVTVYDERDLVLTQTRKAASPSDDSSEIFHYDDNGNVVTAKDGRGNATVHFYDLHDRRTTTTDPLSHFAVIAYDKNSNLTKVSRKNSAGTLLAEETRYVDEVNRVWKTEEMAKTSGGTNLGDGQRTTTYWRDEMGAVLETTDESGGVRSAVYDKAGRTVTTKDALATGQNKLYITYDKRSLVVTRISDEKSQDTGVEPDRTIQTVYQYDSAGRLTKETNQTGDHRTISLNKRDLPKDVVDENGKKQIWRYDELGRVVTQVQELVADSSFTNDVTTEFFYDANSRLVTLRAWSNHPTDDQNTVHAYDNLDRVISSTYPDTFKHQYTSYDKADNRITVVDPNGSTIVSTFDASNRRTQVDITRATGVEGVTKETFAYDGLNRLTNAYNEIKPGQTIDFKTEVKQVWNTLSRLEKETLVIDGYNSGNGRDTSYTYDAEGRVVTLTYPDSTTATYTFDANDRIDLITRGTTTVCDYAFAGPARPIKRDKPGTLSTYKYDALGRVTEIKHKRDSNNYRLFEAIYGYDKTINPEHADLYYYNNSDVRFTSGSDDEGQQYYYDNAYRLTKAYRDVSTGQITTRPPSTGTKYDYDVTGNRTTKKVGGTVDTTYLYDKTNALTSYTTGSTETFTYDKNGNATDHRLGRFSWYDYKNHRVRINNDGSDPTTKSWYDALGRRVQKEQAATGANWVKRYYFAGWQALHEVSWADSTETITHRWVYGPWIDEPLEYTDIAANPDKFYYYHEDHLGSIRTIADDQGGIKESYRYSEWGETATYDASFAAVSDPDVSPIGNRWALTGRQLEEDSAEGATFYRARHFDSALARFLQRDPVPSAPPIFNRYVYVENRPLSGFDPLGTHGGYGGFFPSLGAGFLPEPEPWSDALPPVGGPQQPVPPLNCANPIEGLEACTFTESIEKDYDEAGYCVLMTVCITVSCSSPSGFCFGTNCTDGPCSAQLVVLTVKVKCASGNSIELNIEVSAGNGGPVSGVNDCADLKVKLL